MYSRELRQFAQLLLLQGKQQADVCKIIKNEYGVDVSRQTVSVWAKAAYVDKDMQLQAEQYRTDAADRASLIAGKAQALLLERLDVCLDDLPKLTEALNMLEDAGNNGMIDTELVADAAEKLRDLKTISTRDLSTIIKDAAAEQQRISVMTNGNIADTAIQITFGDDIDDAETTD